MLVMLEAASFHLLHLHCSWADRQGVCVVPDTSGCIGQCAERCWHSEGAVAEHVPGPSVHHVYANGATSREALQLRQTASYRDNAQCHLLVLCDAPWCMSALYSMCLHSHGADHARVHSM